MKQIFPAQMLSAAVAVISLAMASMGTVQADPHEWRGGPSPRDAHAHYDVRFGHNRYYPARGVWVGEVPHDHIVVTRFNERYFYSGGVWYAPRGPRFVVVSPPIGVFVPVLPPFYTTVWVGGFPYYYANDAYYVYRESEHGYEVVEPPGGEQAVSTQPPEQAPQSDEVYIYPKNGQNEDQQARDKYECHKWASSQTGFDPTQTGGGVPPEQNASKRSEYHRAMTACLEGRGYSVK